MSRESWRAKGGSKGIPFGSPEPGAPLVMGAERMRGGPKMARAKIAGKRAAPAGFPVIRPEGK